MRDDEGVGGPDDPARGDAPPDGPDADERAPAQSESQGDSAGDAESRGDSAGSPESQGSPVAGADDGAAGDSGPVPGGASPPAGGGIPESGAGQSRGEVGRDRGPSPQGEPEEDGPGWLLYVYDLVSSVAVVVLIGGLLFAASGVWPPMVAVESPSMEPTMERGDLVYVMEADRFPGDGAHGDTGVVTAERGRETGYQKFGGYGDVIVFEPDGSEQRTPIIHRAMLWVEDGERWVDRANPASLGGADSCSDLPDICPAPHAGFITKGDNNGGYDQVSGIVQEPVKPEWVIGSAELHVPYLGQIRLGSSGVAGSQTVTASGEQADVTVTANGTVATVRNGTASTVRNGTASTVRNGTASTVRLAP